MVYLMILTTIVWSLTIKVVFGLTGKINKYFVFRNFPFRDLIRLDSTNVTDANIIFAAHATVHPLEHASILAVRDAHYEDTGNYFYVYNY